MKWTKYTIKTSNEAEDIISSMLMELGVEGVEIENSLSPSIEDFEAMFIDPQPELLPDEESSLPDGVSLVSFYLRSEDDSSTNNVTATDDTTAQDDSYTIHDRVWTDEETERLLTAIRNELDSMSGYLDIGEGSIEEFISDESDWRNNWKDYFKPQLMCNIIIKPSWTDIPEEHLADVENGSIKVIEMDPGTAFGTGSHETTRLCVDGLMKYLKPGHTVLDIGTGSGILGLCALAMGADYVMATELDPDCEHIILDNIEMNPELAGTHNFQTLIGNILSDRSIIDKVSERGPYNIIVSNILAAVITALAEEGQADSFAAKDTVFITSGIIDTKEKDVVQAFSDNPNWEILGTEQLGEWVSVIAKHL